ncbi:MAG: ATP-binding cassette domain-containing protein [Bacteroidota bacterium]
MVANPSILRVDSVRKEYGAKVAVDDVSFSMPPDAILGLLGPNGAGKTSLIRMITTITQPDQGQIYFEGEPLSAYHPSQIGYLPEERGLYKKMYVGEQLLYLARLKGLDKTTATKRAKEWLDKFGLSDQWPKKVEELSKGMQQQVQFIATVIHNPRLLILDEPFSGLDPVNTGRMRREIAKLREAGTGIIFSTHRMEQVEEICQYIVLINQGRNILEGRVTDIREEFRAHRFRLVYQGQLSADIRANYQVVEENNHEVVFQLQPDQDGNVLLRSLIDSGLSVRAFEEQLPTLNDIFIKQVTQIA